MALFVGVVLLLRCSAALLVFHYSVVFRLFCQYSIRGHKGQNSTGTQCRGLLVLESHCRGFLVLKSRWRGFLSSKKMPWNHDVLAYLSPLLNVVMFYSPYLDIVVFRSWNLDIVVFWFWNPNVVVYMPPLPRFRYHCENKKLWNKNCCWKIF